MTTNFNFNLSPDQHRFACSIRAVREIVEGLDYYPEVIAKLIDVCTSNGYSDVHEGSEPRAYRLLAEALRKLLSGEDAAPAEAQP